MRASALLLIAPLVLAACAGDNNARTDSADYAAGYSDGCATGGAADSYPRGGKVRDERAFQSNADYKSGWRSGYNACLSRSGHDTVGHDALGRNGF